MEKREFYGWDGVDMIFVGIGEKSAQNEEDFSKTSKAKPLQMGISTVIMKK